MRLRWRYPVVIEEACAATSWVVVNAQETGGVTGAIASVLSHDGPVLVDALVNRTELAMPPSITIEMAKGFTLDLVKAIRNGRGDEIIDLAKTNLWR